MAQIALSMILVVTAALLVRSVRNLGRVDLGIDPTNVLIFRIDPTLNGAELPRVRATYHDVLARLATLLGVVTVALSAIGLYGLLAYTVTLRVPEIGIRLALGARRGAVGWMFLRHSLWLCAAGLVIGAGAAAAAAKVVASLLYELPPRNPVAIATAGAILLLASALAGYLPARRAARVDPIVALRAE